MTGKIQPEKAFHILSPGRARICPSVVFGNRREADVARGKILPPFSDNFRQLSKLFSTNLFPASVVKLCLYVLRNLNVKNKPTPIN